MNETEQQKIRQMNAVQIEKIRKQLGEIQKAFLTIKKSGLSRDILIAYLKDKTGFGKNDLLQILEAQDEFYSKIQKLADG